MAHLRIPVELLPRIWSLTRIEMAAYLWLAARCDGWDLKGLPPPRVRLDQLARELDAGVRRVQLAVRTLVVRELVVVRELHDPRGAFYELTNGARLCPTARTAGELEAPPAEAPPERAPIVFDRTYIGAPIKNDRSTSTSSMEDLSIPPSLPSQPATGLAAEGGRAVGFARAGDVLEDVARLFEPRWRRHGAKFLRSKLAPLLEPWTSSTGTEHVATSQQVMAFLRAQVRRHDVQAAKFPPAVACDVAELRAMVERDARRAARAAAATPAPSSRTKRATAPASPASVEAMEGLVRRMRRA